MFFIILNKTDNTKKAITVRMSDSEVLTEASFIKISTFFLRNVCTCFKAA